jgi:site-specific DNA recombinase
MAGAVLYTRVSTQEQARDNNSLPAQQLKLTEYCTRNGLAVVATFTDRGESARTDKRPQFQKMLKFCKDNRKEVSHLLVADLSRLARNVLDQGQTVVLLAELNIKLVSVDEPNLDESAAGKLLSNVIGSMSQFFSDSLSEKTKTRMRAAVTAGRFPWPAPIGYTNQRKMLVVDPVNGPLVQKAFELMASGRYATQDEVRKTVTALGLRTKKGKNVSKQSFARLLQNEIYLGWIVSGDVRVRGSHEPLVSDALFEQVQQRVNKKSVPHTRLHDDFPLRSFIKCAGCGKTLTAGFSQGRNKSYCRYWCHTKGCPDPVGIGCDDLTMHWRLLLGMMEPTAVLLAKLPELATREWATRKVRIAKEAEVLSKRREAQLSMQQKAVVARIEDKISDSDFEGLKRSVAEETFKIEAQIAELDKEKSTFEELTKQANAQVLNLAQSWIKAGPREKQELQWALFPEGISYDPQKRFFAPANVSLVQLLNELFDSLSQDGVPDGI